MFIKVSLCWDGAEYFTVTVMLVCPAGTECWEGGTRTTSMAGAATFLDAKWNTRVAMDVRAWTLFHGGN